MRVNEVMTSSVDLITPLTTVQQASRIMRDSAIGVLPVGQEDRLVGVVTDRDIVVRAIAEGRNAETMPVRDIMSGNVLYCYEDEKVEDVCANMASNQVRRLVVLNREKRMVGMISLGDLASGTGVAAAGETLERISHAEA